MIHDRDVSKLDHLVHCNVKFIVHDVDDNHNAHA
jgi:hypothetical protein